MNDDVVDMLTKILANDNRHIPTEVILQDIVDTETEIRQMKLEAEHLGRTPMSLPNARMDHMRASARKSGIKERQEFVETLKGILGYRKKMEDDKITDLEGSK